MLHETYLNKNIAVIRNYKKCWPDNNVAETQLAVSIIKIAILR